MQTMNVYQIRKGVFAIGSKGRKARAVAQYSRKHGRYIGVRGVKPTIPEDTKVFRGSGKALRETLAGLTA